ncbi:hypothetical protein XF35_24790 [Streptomyces platensis subsp. clarensis]|nr:hypothetical protein [Streptomyces platensis subsp. clarensis]
MNDARALVAQALGCAIETLDGHTLHELGGSSLDAARLAVRLRARAGVSPTAVDLLSAPNLGALLDRANDKPAAGGMEGPAPGAEVTPGDLVPLTWQQRIVWYQTMLEPASPRYHFHALFHFAQAPDTNALTAEFRDLLRRHPALRVRVVFTDGEPWQQVPPHEVPASEAVVTVVTAGNGTRTAEKLIEAAGADKPFDLAAGPLVRWTLVRLPGGGATLVHTEHHLVHDGVSFDILSQGLGTGQPGGFDDRYFRHARNRPETDPELARRVAGRVTEAAGELFPRKERPEASDPFLRLPLPGGLLNAVRATAREESVSLFAALFTAFGSALARTRGREGMVVGTAVGNRPEGLEDVVGMFVSTTPVVLDRLLDDSPHATLRRTADALTEAVARADVPLPEIVDAAAGALQRDGRGPVSAAFSMHEQFTRRATLAGQDADVELGAFNGAAKFPVNAIIVADRGSEENGLTLLVEGAREYIGEDDLWALWSHFIGWLRELTGTRSETGPQADDLVAAIHSTAERSGDRAALDDGTERLTYADLVHLGEALRTHTRERGSRVIGLLGTASVRFFGCAFAVMDAGATYVPLDADRHRDLIGDIVRRAGCDLVVDLTGKPGGRPFGDVPILTWETLKTAGTSTPAPSGPDTTECPAYVVFTSGSTGIPKGVEVSRASLSLLCRWSAQETGLKEATVASQFASVGFDAAVLEVWPPLYVGATVRVAPDKARKDPHELAAWLTENAIECAFLPTPMAELLATVGLPETAALRVLSVGGDRLHPLPSPQPFRVLNLYGPTECTVVATRHWVDQQQEGLPPIGTALPYGTQRVVDRHGAEVAPGTLGELWIGGGGVANGYVGQELATSARFVPDPHSPSGDLVYRTGDVVRSGPDGVLDFVGREDRQVKISGVRVELGEIEATALRQPGVAQAAAVLTDEDDRNQVRLFLVPAAPGDTTGTTRQVRSALPAFLRHVPVEYVPALPLDPNGKVDLTMLTGEGPRPGSGAPLIRLAADYVDTADLSVGWFALGGSSLDAARLVSRAHAELGVRLSLVDLFAADSVADYLGAADPDGDDHGADGREVPASRPDRPGSHQKATADLLWPTLERLPARDKLEIAQRLVRAALDEVDG